MIRLILTLFLATSVFGFWNNGKIAFDNDTTTYTCTKPGKQCSPDCKAVLYCPGSSGDASVLDDCVDDQKCTQTEENDFVCSSNVTTCNSAELPVTCGGAGPYPAAYNCSVGYFCLQANEKPEYKCECPENYYYESGFCSGDTNGYQSCCEDPAAIPKCTKVGDMQNFGSNCHIGFYYVCSREDNHLVAKVFRCEPGEIFINGQGCKAVKNNIKPKEIGSKLATTCSKYEDPLSIMRL